LTKWKQDEQEARRRVTDELPRLIREEFTAPVNALNDSIHDLTAFLREAHMHRAQTTTTLDELMTSLTDRLAEQHTSPNPAHPERRPYWPKRSLVSARRPTA
jgi:hypothetical protein